MIFFFFFFFANYVLSLLWTLANFVALYTIMGLCARSILSHQFRHSNLCPANFDTPIVTLFFLLYCCNPQLRFYCNLRLWNSLQSTYYRHHPLWSALLWKLSGSWLHHDGNLFLNLRSQDGVSVLLEGDLCNLFLQLKCDTMNSANFWLFCQLCLESFKWTLCQIYDFIC